MVDNLEKKWLDNAISLDYNISINELYAERLTELIFSKIQMDGKLYQNKYQPVFTMILANLKRSFELMMPLHYSRQKSLYPRAGVGYTVMLQLVDALVEINFIKHETGKQNFDDGVESRFWIEKDNNFLFDYFQIIQPEHIIKSVPDPIIRLMNREKGSLRKEIPYKKTQVVKRMEKQLYKYNRLLEKTNIELHCDWGKLKKHDEAEDKNERVKLVNIISLKRHVKLKVLYPLILNSIVPETNTNVIPIPRITKELYKFYNDEDAAGIGLELKYKFLHRSFSENFKQGGRFYGASWLNFSGEMRNNIFINNEKTCEPDFSCLHLRMLYHQAGIDFRDDVYGDEYRDLMKKVAMIVINIKHKKSVTATLKKIFGWHFSKKDGGNIDKNNIFIKKYGEKILEKDFINNLVNRFCLKHKAISEFFFNDMGIKLQNIDSKITADIMNYFTRKKIAVLAVHDSYIIQEKHKDELIKVMNETYKERIGFYPVIH